MSTLDETVDSIGNEPFDLIPGTMNQHFGHPEIKLVQVYVLA